MLYERDPELREALAKSDINTIGLKDKFTMIIKAKEGKLCRLNFGIRNGSEDKDYTGNFGEAGSIAADIPRRWYHVEKATSRINKY